MTSPTLLSVPFQSGQDSKTHPDYVSAGAQTSATNVRFSKGGAVAKRWGYKYLSQNLVGLTGGFAVARKALAFNGQPYIIADRGGSDPLHYGLSLWSRSFAGNAWSDRGPVPECVATWSPIQYNATSVNAFDCAYAAGPSGPILCLAWIRESILGAFCVYASVVDLTTGAVLVNERQINSTGTVTCIRVVAVPTLSMFMLAWTTTAGSQLLVSKLDFSTLTSLAWTSPTNPSGVFTDVGTFFDMIVEPGGLAPSMVIAYPNTGGGTHQVTVARVDVAGAGFNVATLQIAEGTLVEGIGVACKSSIEALVTWNSGDATATVSAVFNPTGSMSLTYAPAAWNATSTSGTVTTEYIGGGNYVVISGLSTSGSEGVTWRVVTPGANVSPVRTTLGVLPLGRPFVQGGKTFMTGCFADPDHNQPTIWLVDLKAEDTTTVSPLVLARPVATIAPRAANLSGLSLFAVCSIVNAFTTEGPTWFTLGAATVSATGKAGLVLIGFDFTSENLWAPVQLGESLYLAGGVPMMFDGESVVEIGFPTYPCALSLADHGSGGALSAGSYSVIVVFEVWNAAGEVTQSSSSAPQEITLSGSHSIDVTVDYLHFTNRVGIIGTSVQEAGLVIYRTLANGSIYYRSTSTSLSLSNFNNAYATNVTINDNVSDAVLSVNQEWLADGGQGSAVNNVCPPSFVAMCSHNSRLWGISGDQRTIWYTKTYTANETANFADELTFRIDDGGALTALCGLDANLVVFTADRIYYLAGDGAADDGTQSTLSTPAIPIASDVGCMDPRSLVATPQGLFFLSRIGIYLLGRDLSVSYVGKAIEDTLTTYPICVSACLVPGETEIRFVLRDVDDTATNRHSVVAVYNYLFGAWSVSEFHPAGTGSSIYSYPDPVCSSATGLVGSTDSHFILFSNGDAYYEATGQSLDAGTWVTTTIESSWLKTVDVSGYQRARNVRVKNDNKTPHGLTISLGYNFDAGYTDSVSFSDSALSGLAREDVNVHVGATGTRCQAIRIKLQDNAPTVGSLSTGIGPVWVSVDVEVIARPGAYRPIGTAGKG